MRASPVFELAAAFVIAPRSAAPAIATSADVMTDAQSLSAAFIAGVLDAIAAKHAD